MRRRRKKRTQLSVSLFPFLAVLICTLGVLIVMLVMAVKSADDQATKIQSDDDGDKRTRIAELRDEVELRQLQIRGKESVRPNVLARLNQCRSNRSYLEDEIRKLKREFKRVNQELMDLEHQPEPTVTNLVAFSQVDAAEALRVLEKNVEDAKTALARKRETAALAAPETYVIVPHKGGGGTFRRPIYVECTKNAITLQPSGIRLSKDEFMLPLQPGNILDSALLANREYWQRYDLAGEEGSPYPLIVVRPDGAETFVLARRAMQSWDDEFGYELVGSDRTLEFGTSDPQLNAEINDAIMEARRRQRDTIAIMAASRRRAAQLAGRQEPRPGLTASGRSGGFVSTAGGGPGDTGWDSDQEESEDEFDRSHDSRQTNHSISSQDRNQLDGETATSGSGVESKSKAKNGVGGDLAIQNPNQDASLAQKRGSDWALPSKTAGATGYVRPIRIYCGPDFLELNSVDGQSKRIPFTGKTESAVDPMVEQIWQLIDSWGISGAHSYWKPQLRVTILPGGKARLEELKQLLHHSGLSVEEFRQ